ncbi:hypothetical protein QX776_04660 [Alteromonadaceae bacterium BrNp21-10]|nr:hypothetical protein [Alteromonadaceae bacterium BrNp21-10]
MISMNQEYINQHNVLQRYFSNSLNQDEQIAFESYVLDKPQLLEQLELHHIFDRHLSDAFSKNHDSKKFSFSQWLFGKRHSKKLFWAGLGALSSGTLTFVLMMTLMLPNTTENGFSSVSPEIVYLETMRGSESVTNIHFKINQKVKMLVVDTGLPNAQIYHLEIKDKRNITISNWAHKAVNENGELVVMLARKMLSNGRYTMIATNYDNSQKRYIYPLNVSLN